MKVAPKYRTENRYAVAVLKDNTGYFTWERSSLEILYESLLNDTIRESIKVVAIYPDTNHDAIKVINRAINDLNQNKKVDLENLLSA